MSHLNPEYFKHQCISHRGYDLDVYRQNKYLWKIKYKDISLQSQAKDKMKVVNMLIDDLERFNTRA